MDHTSATLLTVIVIGQTQSVITADWIQQCMKHYEETDDVFQKEFLQAFIFSGGQNDASISPEARALLRESGVQWHHFLSTGPGYLPCPGPYILLGGYLHEPFRLYSDENAAFFSATR